MHTGSSPSKRGKARHSLDAFDRLFEKAFAPKETPMVTPLMLSTELKRPQTPEPPDTPSTPGPDIQVTPQCVSMDPLWKEVRQSKERQLAALPSKVQSIEMAPNAARKLSKRKSSVNFRESPDGRTVTTTFEIPGVRKQDMHRSRKARYWYEIEKKGDTAKPSHYQIIPALTKFKQRETADILYSHIQTHAAYE